MSDGSLDRLLVVQDLDTLITQLTHRRAALAERVGLVGARRRAGRAGGRGGGPRGAPSRAGGDAEGPRGADRRGRPTPDRHRAAHVRRPRLLDPRPPGHGRGGPAPEPAPERARGRGTGGHGRPGADRCGAGRAGRQEGADRGEGDHPAGRGGAGAGRDRRRAGGGARRHGRARRRQLPPALSERYEALRARLKGTGAARLVGHRCSGCHLELSPVEVDRIRAMSADTVVTCDQCGRILVPT